jgi:hypothetical protein
VGRKSKGFECSPTLSSSRGKLEVQEGDSFWVYDVVKNRNSGACVLDFPKSGYMSSSLLSKSTGTSQLVSEFSEYLSRSCG